MGKPRQTRGGRSNKGARAAAHGDAAVENKENNENINAQESILVKLFDTKCTPESSGVAKAQPASASASEPLALSSSNSPNLHGLGRRAGAAAAAGGKTPQAASVAAPEVAAPQPLVEADSTSTVTPPSTTAPSTASSTPTGVTVGGVAATVALVAEERQPQPSAPSQAPLLLAEHFLTTGPSAGPPPPPPSAPPVLPPAARSPQQQLLDQQRTHQQMHQQQQMHQHMQQQLQQQQMQQQQMQQQHQQQHQHLQMQQLQLQQHMQQHQRPPIRVDVVSVKTSALGDSSGNYREQLKQRGLAAMRRTIMWRAYANSVATGQCSGEQHWHGSGGAAGASNGAESFSMPAAQALGLMWSPQDGAVPSQAASASAAVASMPMAVAMPSQQPIEDTAQFVAPSTSSACARLSQAVGEHVAAEAAAAVMKANTGAAGVDLLRMLLPDASGSLSATQILEQLQTAQPEQYHD